MVTMKSDELGRWGRVTKSRVNVRPGNEGAFTDNRRIVWFYTDCTK